MVKSLDTNGDGKITKEKADGAAWFGRVDQNNDGVLDAGELETVRRASAAWAGGGAAPQLGTPAQGGDQIIDRIKSLDPNGESNEIGKSSWYLVRYADGTYRYQRIWDENNPLTDSQYGLRGCRSIRPSPFPEEAGRVWYFCGFDQTGARGAGATGPAGWIYQGALPSTNEDER
jgi:hypothetical protein